MEQWPGETREEWKDRTFFLRYSSGPGVPGWSELTPREPGESYLEWKRRAFAIVYPNLDEVAPVSGLEENEPQTGPPA